MEYTKETTVIDIFAEILKDQPKQSELAVEYMIRQILLNKDMKHVEAGKIIILDVIGRIEKDRARTLKFVTALKFHEAFSTDNLDELLDCMKSAKDESKKIEAKRLPVYVGVSIGKKLGLVNKTDCAKKLGMTKNLLCYYQEKDQILDQFYCITIGKTNYYLVEENVTTWKFIKHKLKRK